MWTRIDLDDGSQKICEIEGTVSTLRTKIEESMPIKVNRQIISIPTKGQNDQPSLAFVELKNAHPVFSICEEEWINGRNIRSFGIIDESSNMWKRIKESATGEQQILTPELKVVK